MSKSLGSAMILFLVVILAACGGGSGTNAGNAPVNSNTNAAKPTAAAPTAEQLLETERKVNEAYLKGDSKFFESWLSDKFVTFDRGVREDKAAAVKMIAGVKCDIKDGWKLDEPQLAKIDSDTYVLTYKGTFDGTCTFGGQTEKVPSPIRAATVVVRSGNDWKAVFHGENPIIDPTAQPATNPKSDTKTTDKPEVSKKDDTKPAEPAGNSNTTPPTKPVPGANTDALTKIHLSGWEAWKAKDQKKLEEIASSDLSIVDPIGGFISGRSNVVKGWFDMKCEGITKVGLTDGFASAVSPTLEILTVKGKADGSCEGQKNGDLYQTTFFVKEGDTWKLAFMFEAMPM